MDIPGVENCGQKWAETSKLDRPGKADRMAGAPKGLLILAVITFIIAIVGTFTGDLINNIPPEGFSRASTNLALLAIAIHMIEGSKDSD
jgi:hypothetical protein